MRDMAIDPAAPEPDDEVAGDQQIVQREIVAVGASAGGVEALRELVANLPPELPAAVLVVMHVLPTGTSMLPAILGRAGRLPCSGARNAEKLERGHIYVAPPDHHLLVLDGRVQLSHGPRENGHRPALDTLFRSVARTYGTRSIGVVLSGTLDDGAAGLRMIRARGGATIAQDPEEALYSGMPQSAIDNGAVAHVSKISEMADLICTLIEEPVEQVDAVAGNPGGEADFGPTLDMADVTSPVDGDLTPLTCPECGGALWEHQEGHLVRFKCHVGHAYSAESMQALQGNALEAALWSALRSLQERQNLFERMARRTAHSPGTSARFQQKARDVSAHAEAIRQTIAELGGTSTAAGEPSEPAA
jgi:two-component system, chemotaxis family, protein-glutamate methylesterase/glutaminase